MQWSDRCWLACGCPLQRRTRRGSRATRHAAIDELAASQPEGRGRSCGDLLRRPTLPDRLGQRLPRVAVRSPRLGTVHLALPWRKWQSWRLSQRPGRAWSTPFGPHWVRAALETPGPRRARAVAAGVEASQVTDHSRRGPRIVERGGGQFESHPTLPRAEGPANEAGAGVEPHPPVKLVPSPPGPTNVVPAYRAMHSGPDRSRPDNHGQHHSGCHLRRSPIPKVTTPPDLALQAGGQRELSRPATEQRSERCHAHSTWFADSLLTAGVTWRVRRGVCPGGRDRDRTCGFCRVKVPQSPPAVLVLSVSRPASSLGLPQETLRDRGCPGRHVPPMSHWS
jgi:hypothetical protein